MNSKSISHPLAVAMWDFSWLERRWAGAGYENWDEALDSLVERGYDCIRIDVFPHLLADSSKNGHVLKPVWTVHDWGAPDLLKVYVERDLPAFLEAVRKRPLKLALSTWFRDDEKSLRMKIKTAQDHAKIWLNAVKFVSKYFPLNRIAWVDLANEWPLNIWVPFFKNEGGDDTVWATKKSMNWMKSSIDILRQSFPELKYTYSLSFNFAHLKQQDLSFFDLLEMHCWMAQEAGYYKKLGYKSHQYSGEWYSLLGRKGRDFYFKRKVFWQKELIKAINNLSDYSRSINRPLATTEGWGLVDYKDWPGLEWDWVKEITSIGAKAAAESGSWAAVTTSNFCGPQFRGIWNDKAWHVKLNGHIKKQKVFCGL